MQKKENIIDIFVSIVDNYGDMGTACELAQSLQKTYPWEFQYHIWTDNVSTFESFASRAGVDGLYLGDIYDFWKKRKSAIWISILHSPIPDLDLFEEKSLILRLDYLSLDWEWIKNNEQFHIASTQDRQIIELIPSPFSESAGLLPLQEFHTEYDILSRHIVIFTYSDSLDRIDFDSFPDDIVVYIFWKADIVRPNFRIFDFVPFSDFYTILDSSEFVIIRGETSFSHIIQTRVPFFWDMYRAKGGFPDEQSIQFLDMIQATPEYREIHRVLNGKKDGKITYQDMRVSLSHSHFPQFWTKNLIHSVKKHIDRFNNSI